MDEARRHLLVWGWLRFFLAVAQLLLAATAIVVLLTMGLSPAACWLAISATVATIVSRLLYRGRSVPKSAGDNHSAERTVKTPWPSIPAAILPSCGAASIAIKNQLDTLIRFGLGGFNRLWRKII